MRISSNPGSDDHRVIGRELDFFFLDEEVGPGLVCLRPNGGLVRHLLEDLWVKKHVDAGYGLVYSPHVAKLDLWRRSGHWDRFSDDVFPPMRVGSDEYLLRPTACHLHIMNFKARQHSYRDLPVRLAELATVYRWSSVRKGLAYTCGITQDDAHLFCTPDQVQDELVRILELALYFFKVFGFSPSRVVMRTRPPQSGSIGSRETWDQAVGWIEGALDMSEDLKGVPVEFGAGSFYAPCVDIMVKGVCEREWWLTNIQVDLNLPKLFDVTYVARDGKRHPVVIIHRCVTGSMERLIAVLLEQNGGALPIWLSPVQLAVLPCADRHLCYSRDITSTLKKHGFRVQLAVPDRTLNYRIRQMRRTKTPFILVIGDREVTQQTVSVRERGNKVSNSMKVSELVAYVQTRLDRELPEG